MTANVQSRAFTTSLGRGSTPAKPPRKASTTSNGAPPQIALVHTPPGGQPPVAAAGGGHEARRSSPIYARIDALSHSYTETHRALQSPAAPPEPSAPAVIPGPDIAVIEALLCRQGVLRESAVVWETGGRTSGLNSCIN